MAPDGSLSPQLDVVLVDARYPLLAQNTDGSVLVMLHSVLKTIEVKTRATSSDITKALDTRVIQNFVAQIDREDEKEDKTFRKLAPICFATGCDIGWARYLKSMRSLNCRRTLTSTLMFYEFPMLTIRRMLLWVLCYTLSRRLTRIKEQNSRGYGRRVVDFDTIRCRICIIGQCRMCTIMDFNRKRFFVGRYW